jgi:quercetin dioxygenase-like cupin family protein
MRIATLERLRVDDEDGVDIMFVADLADPGARVQVARFAAGDTLPKHSAGTWQVFAVVSGEGVVAGDDDDVRTVLGPGAAAVWQPGEHHTSWATTDMVVVVVESVSEPHLS